MMGTSDKDQSLTDRRHLEINDRIQHWVIPTGIFSRREIVVELSDTEMIVEERRLDNHGEEDDRRSCEIDAIDDGIGENFSEIPTVWIR